MPMPVVVNGNPSVEDYRDMIYVLLFATFLSFSAGIYLALFVDRRPLCRRDALEMEEDRSFRRHIVEGGYTALGVFLCILPVILWVLYAVRRYYGAP
jgi:hypothetical protein